MSEDLIAKFYDHVREVKDLGFKDGYGGDVGIQVTRSRFTVIPVPSRDYWDSSWEKTLNGYVAGDKGFAVEIVNLRYGEPGGKQPAKDRYLFKTEEEAEAHVTAYVQARLKYAASRIQEEEAMIDGKKLAPRAVKCKRWRWMPGMLLRFNNIGSSEDYAIRLDCDGWGGVLGKDSDGFVHHEDTENDPHENHRPDLSDPATLGCLLALVRKAWGDENGFIDPRGGWHVCIGSKGPEHGHDIEIFGDSEAEALVAALENAP